MVQSELVVLPDIQLFKLCAVDPNQDEYWTEFNRRYNQLLVGSVYHAYRRFARVKQPPEGVVAELLQDTYVQILKDDCLTLRRFRGNTDVEARIYLAQVAINVTINYLRRTHALKRQAGMVQLEEILRQNGTVDGLVRGAGDYTSGLAELELIEALRHICKGPNKRRNILLFLLHVREGLTARELAASGVCNLESSSIAHILAQIKAELKKVLWQ
jgi:DNA-directed RNA polymerase specialized sigma24 family protein